MGNLILSGISLFCLNKIYSSVEVSYMGVFEDLYIKMRDEMCKIGDKTGKILNISKIKIEMAEKKNSIFEKYRLIGKYVYDMYDNGENFEFEDIADWLEEVKNLKLSMKDCEKRLHRAQDKLFCPYCNCKNESGAIFCNHCGKKILFCNAGEKKNDCSRENSNANTGNCGVVDNEE